jgi:hypothetical protein
MSLLKTFACRECDFETNNKEEFKKHAKTSHEFDSFCENNLARKDLLLEGPSYGSKTELEVI